VTGNNYHDETDFFIKSRGLNYAFTRTYNSGQQATTLDGILGVGWVHSYAMKLKANDWGDCPDCAAGTGVGQRPENGNGVTASVTYVDERGGEHLYRVDETSKAVASPQGEFDILSFDSPSAGYHTLAFRNGVKYVFQTVDGGILKNTPGVLARLARIEDPYGNVLNLTYNTSGQLTQVRDNLNIATRTGLILAYFTNGRLKSVTDWSGRQWQYSYDGNGNLDFALNPLNQKIDYGYQEGGAGPHDLTEVILPELRNGQPVKTAFQYYRNGRAFSQKNALNQGETLQYDLYRRSTRVTDARNAVRTHTYDANGVLIFSNQADGLRYQKYDALNYATQYSYRSDRSFGNASDNGGNVSRERDALNHDTDIDYGLYDQVTAVKDKNGHYRRTVYAAATTATAALCGDVKGKAKEIRADIGGQLDVLLANHTYDEFGNPCVTREYIEAGNTGRFRETLWGFDADNLYPDFKIVNQSDDTGKLYQSIDYQYDSLGRLTSETLYRKALPDPNDSSALAQTTIYQYDALDRRVKTTDPEGRIYETFYDANGQVAQEKTWHPANTAKTGCAAPTTISGSSYVICTDATHQYDAADRRIATTDILGHTTQFGYDAAGNLVKITDANGHITQYEYDAMSRRTAVIDGNGHRIEAKYNLRGEAISVTNANGETVNSEYDAIGRLTKVINPLSHETRYQYDANGNLTCRIDANAMSNAGDPGHQPLNADGCTESRQYDEWNRLKQSKDAQGNITAYSYDLFGNRTAITDAENHTTAFRYDDLGRLIEIVDPLVETPADKTQTFVYDEAGNLIEAADRKGQVSRYTYDRLNRNTQVDHLADTSQETNSYDAFGDLIQSQNANVAYTYTYDAKHQLKSKTDSRANKTLSWTYDPAGNFDTKTDYQGDVTDYQYDNANRLTAETNPAYLQVSYHYDGAGRLIDRILSNGAITHYGWDAAGRLTRLKNTTITGQLVNDTAYTRDRIGNILTQTDTNALGQVTGTTIYSYDPEYRLKTADYPGSANDESFSYDKVGNRKSHSLNGSTKYYNVDAGNRLKDIRTGSPTGTVYESYSYDDNGSLTNISGNRSQTLIWDANNRVRQINTSQYRYDPAGYRIQKTAGGATSRYYLQGEHLEAIYDQSNVLQAECLRSTVIDEVVNGYQKDAAGKLLNYTYHHDALQSVLGQSGHEGNILATQTYSAFGTINQTGSSNNKLKYTGREQDSESGFYYYRARYYDPLTGRFTINANDPSGNAALQVGGTIVGAVGGVIVQGGIDLTRGQISSFADYAGAFVGGGAGGAAAVTCGPVCAGATAGGVSAATTQGINWVQGQTTNLWSVGVDAALSALGGKIASQVVPYAFKTALPNLVGTYSANQIKGAIGEGMTWLDLVGSGKGLPQSQVGNGFYGRNGIESTFDFRTNSGIFIEAKFGTAGLNRGAQTAAADFWGSQGLFELQSWTYPIVSGIFGSSFAAGSANGGFVLYPNKSNTNMMQSVYAK